MKRALVVVAAVLAIAAAVLGVLLVVASSDEPAPTFTEAEAEAAVRRALERCRHDLRDAREVDCREVVNGFACRADGRFVAGFREPDPERPQFSVSC